MQFDVPLLMSPVAHNPAGLAPATESGSGASAGAAASAGECTHTCKKKGF